MPHYKSWSYSGSTEWLFSLISQLRQKNCCWTELESSQEVCAGVCATFPPWFQIRCFWLADDCVARARPSNMSEFLSEDFLDIFCDLCNKIHYWIDFGLTKLLVLVQICLTALEFWIYKHFQKFPREFSELQSKGKAKQCSF